VLWRLALIMSRATPIFNSNHLRPPQSGYTAVSGSKTFHRPNPRSMREVWYPFDIRTMFARSSANAHS
jgi:hypothetical protein